MKILALHCPYCGGTIKFDLDKGKKFCFCVHCGQQVILDDEVIRTEHTERKIDEARIKEADVKAQIELEKFRIYEKELEAYDRRKKIRLKLGIGWAIIFGIIIITAAIIYFFTWYEDLGYGIGFGGIMWLVVGEFGLWMPSLKDEPPASPLDSTKQ